MAGGDRLSDLPYDLLLRVLHFAPAKEAASTASLSRRWRSSPWRSSGAVNLETRVEDYKPRSYRDDPDEEPLFFSKRDAFVSAASAALSAAAAAAPVTRLTLRLAFSDGGSSIRKFLYREPDYSDWSYTKDEDGVVAALLSHPAARRVEELRVTAEYTYGFVLAADREVMQFEDEWVGVYALRLESLPSETLRVLELTNCNRMVFSPAAPAGAGVFPRLASLRLRQCTTSLDDIQGLIDAAPALAVVHLDSVVVDVVVPEGVPPPKEEGVIVRSLRCPAATVLVLERCGWKTMHHNAYYNNAAAIVGLEIDAPRLQRFTYKGLLRPISLNPPPPDLVHADLQFFPVGDERGSKNYKINIDHQATFWGCLQSTTAAKAMKLTVHNLEDIAVLSEARRVELLPAFRGLERLELQGVHRPKGKTAAVAIANLLRCCPVLRDLRINLVTARHHDPMRYISRECLEKKFRSDCDKSVDLFNRSGTLEPMVVNSPEGDDGIDVNYDMVCDIPGLNPRSFECLRSSVRRVSLQFRLLEEWKNCFGIKLIKFFAENAMVLEEMCIDGGNGKLCEHMNRKVERWINANSSKRRNSGATDFEVSPLKRRAVNLRRMRS